MAALERTHWDIGIHKGDYEPPDIVHIRLNGSMTLDDAKEIVRILTGEVVPKLDGPTYLILYLAPSTGGFSSEAKKYFGTIKVTWHGVCVVGGTTLGRAAMNIAIRAINLVSGNPIPARLVKTNEEAYAFVNELRAKAAAKAPNP